MNKSRFCLLLGMVITAAAFRLLPHPPNFSPIAAIALFGGAKFPGRFSAFVVPLGAMFLSDLVLGLHAFIPIIYGCFALIVLLGFKLRQKASARRIFATALIASGLFFTVTNFSVWALSTMYPHTGGGLLACYIAAIPFFANTLFGDLVFTGILFGGVAAAEWQWPVLRPHKMPVTQNP